MGQARRKAISGLAVFTIAVLGAGIFGVASDTGAGAVGTKPVTVTITSSANPSVNGQTVTFTATVTGAAGVPTGKVTPYKNGSAHSSVTLDAQGRASWSYTFSPGTTTAERDVPGQLGLRGRFESHDHPDHQPRRDDHGRDVERESEQRRRVGDPDRDEHGGRAGDVHDRSGTVNFYDGVTKIGSKSASSGKAAISITTLARGSHAITATFPSTSKCVGSTSPVMTQTVSPRPTTTTLTSTPNPSTLGQK